MLIFFSVIQTIVIQIFFWAKLRQIINKEMTQNYYYRDEKNPEDQRDGEPVRVEFKLVNNENQSQLANSSYHPINRKLLLLRTYGTQNQAVFSIQLLRKWCRHFGSVFAIMDPAFAVVDLRKQISVRTRGMYNEVGFWNGISVTVLIVINNLFYVRM